MKLDPASANNQLIFPNDDTLSRVYFNDPAMVNNDDYITTLAGGPGPVAGRAR